MITRNFQRRYLFTGDLVLTTGMHIGGGTAELSPSDSPVIRTPDGQPYIPGSSFKGSFRSTVEKLAPALERHSCALQEGAGCPGAQGVEQKQFNQARQATTWDDQTLLRHLAQGIRLDNQELRLCDTCWLFGSPYAASKIAFYDLYLKDTTEGIVEVRDGVAIDRDSEKQVPGLLYNYEVVAPAMIFGVTILLEDPNDIDLGLTCLGLSEFRSGFGSLGGKRSRGLGRCELTNLAVYALDLTVDNKQGERARRLRNYLLGKTPAEKMQREANADAFLEKQITALLGKGA
jgi:CRISPR-associated RAMP protein (TIGR02581 family)